MKSMYLAAVLLLGVCVHTGLAVKCYQCGSEPSGRLTACKYPLTESQTVGGCDYCGKADYTLQGKSYLSRYCSQGTAHDLKCETKSDGDNSGTECYCDTDKCNGAVHLTLTLFSLLAVPLAHWLL